MDEAADGTMKGVKRTQVLDLELNRLDILDVKCPIWDVRHINHVRNDRTRAV